MRLFIGMKVPATLRERIQKAWLEATQPTVDCRPIDPANWHFTLAFLGEVDPENRSALELLIGQMLEQTPKGPFSFKEFETFPAKNPTYVVARATPQYGKEWNLFIERLRDMVSVAAPEVDRKPWLPHISIAREKKDVQLPVWSRRIDPFNWDPSELTLVLSETSGQGSKYTDLHVFPFHI